MKKHERQFWRCVRELRRMNRYEAGRLLNKLFFGQLEVKEAAAASFANSVFENAKREAARERGKS